MLGEDAGVGAQSHDTDMVDPLVSSRQIQRFSGRLEARPDYVAVEEPLAIWGNGEPLAVIMRTPGHDLELVRGLLQSEGAIRGTSEWTTVSVVPEQDLKPLERGNVVNVGIDEGLLGARWAGREVITSSSCGVCGASALAVLEQLASPVHSTLQWTPAEVLRAPELLRLSQEAFSRTGGLHGAALFSQDGLLLACREDVGRHNAVDKIVGWALAASMLPLTDYVLCVSGRLSYEIVHKVIVAGIPMIVAPSAPSSLAIDLAERWSVTLAGFVREGTFNIYSHASRIRAD